MALSHAILVSLLDRPQAGYDLAKLFDKTVGQFWRASHQQIYGELHKLAAKNFVEAETIEQSDRPNKIVYSLTDDGRRALDDWMAAPTTPPSIKEDLIVKLFSSGRVDAAVLLANLRQRQQLARERLAEWEAVRDEFYPDTNKLTPRQTGRYLGLQSGITSELRFLDWCDEAISLLTPIAEKESQAAKA